MNNKKVKDLTFLTLWKHKMDEKVQILGGRYYLKWTQKVGHNLKVHFSSCFTPSPRQILRIRFCGEGSVEVLWSAEDGWWYSWFMVIRN